MGANVSSPERQAPGGFGAASAAAMAGAERCSRGDLGGGPPCHSRPSSLTRHCQVPHGMGGGGDLGIGDGAVGGAGVVVPREKKKKTSRLATLRKKLMRPRRHSRSLDYSKAMRELLSTWSVRDVHGLVEEYEASACLKDLSLLAGLARPHANTFREDLSRLYDFKYCTDVDLVYQGVVFPVHRAILSVRCPYFRDFLARFPDYGAQVPIHIRTPAVNVNMFSALLRFLYTGEINPRDTRWESMEVLSQLAREFGTPNPLEQDLRTLLETGIHGDALLMFSSDCEHQGDQANSPDAYSDSRAVHKPAELRCHKAILAARSPFFRNLLLRRARSGEELTERALQSPTCIVLDESVIPRRYARVLLHAVYLDTVDLGCIVRSSSSTCSLSEVQAMVAGRSHMTLTEEAMEIYQIGQFLDMAVLSQGCEDIVAESLSTENLVSVLQWSQEAHGSAWVRRQALHFLREEFQQIAHSSILCELSREYLLQAIKSDFLQAGESEVLGAVLKWGEHQLIRRIEEREPNILSHTAHSISKKGIKKRDLNDLELREILRDLLPHVRTDHILPANHEGLHGAVKRGLLSRPPSHMLADEACGGGHGGGGNNAGAWVRGKHSGMFVKPRFFTPYYEEAKAVLEEQLSQVQETEVVRLRTVHMSNIPDTLYMVEERCCYSPCYSRVTPVSTATVDIIAGTIPVPDDETHQMMLKRESDLQASKLVQRAYSLPYSDLHQVCQLIRLRVVREFGLPDCSTELLHAAPGASHSHDLLSEARYVTPPRRNQPSRYPLGMPMSRQAVPLQLVPQHGHWSSPAYRLQGRAAGGRGRGGLEPKACPSTPVSPSRSRGSPVEKEPSICSDSILSEFMPDIAMATSSLNQLSLQPPDLDLDLSHHQPQAGPDLELDLGDGTNHGTQSSSHSGHGTLYI